MEKRKTNVCNLHYVKRRGLHEMDFGTCMQGGMYSKIRKERNSAEPD